jgi:uncharacterized protein
MPKHLERAFITGASSGLGRALCHLLADKGIPLIITGRDQSKLEVLAHELKVPVICQAVDLADPTSRSGLVRLLHNEAPTLIINNAGFGLYGESLDHPSQEQLDILEVNAKALLELTLEGARAMIDRKERGIILNISSAAGFFPFPLFSVYAASKAFVTHLSQALDVEFAPHGVRVLTCCPGQIATSFRARAAKGFPQKADLRTMSAEKAARLIYRQIEKGKPLQIIDWRTRILTSIARLLPNPLLLKILKASLTSRYKK